MNWLKETFTTSTAAKPPSLAWNMPDGHADC
jgi:hypothetical protein